MGFSKGDAELVQVQSVEEVRGNRIRIVLEDGTRYTLTKTVYEERTLLPGDIIDPQEYARWVLVRQYRSALDKAVSLLALRSHSQGEIRRKLTASGYSSETVEMVLFKLNKHHLIDDTDFAIQFAQSRTGRHIGPRRISAELRSRGISDEDTQSALAEITEDRQLNDALQVAEKAFRSSKRGEDPRKTRQRIIAAVVRRGYDWEIAREAASRFFDEDPE